MPIPCSPKSSIKRNFRENETLITRGDFWKIKTTSFWIFQFNSLDSPRHNESDPEAPLLAPDLDAPLVRTKDEVNAEAKKSLVKVDTD